MMHHRNNVWRNGLKAFNTRFAKSSLRGCQHLQNDRIISYNDKKDNPMQITYLLTFQADHPISLPMDRQLAYYSDG